MITQKLRYGETYETENSPRRHEQNSLMWPREVSKTILALQASIDRNESFAKSGDVVTLQGEVEPCAPKTGAYIFEKVALTSLFVAKR